MTTIQNNPALNTLTKKLIAANAATNEALEAAFNKETVDLSDMEQAADVAKAIESEWLAAILDLIPNAILAEVKAANGLELFKLNLLDQYIHKGNN